MFQYLGWLAISWIVLALFLCLNVRLKMGDLILPIFVTRCHLSCLSYHAL